MLSLIDSLAVYGLLALGGGAVGAGLSALLYLASRRRLREYSPQGRQLLLLALLVCPLLAVLALMASMSAPLTLLQGAEAMRHCSSHPALHAALCQWHAPNIALPNWLAAMVLISLALAAVAAVRNTVRVLATGRRLYGLRQMGRWQAREAYLLLPMRRPLAFVSGMTRPRAVLSEGLRRRLDPQSLRIVLAHEHAHARHRDPLVAVAASALAKLHWPRIGRALRSEWRLAVEQRCDEAVAHRTGDRLAVAECLLRVARLQNRHQEIDGACHLLDGHLDTRIAALVVRPAAPRAALTLSIASIGATMMSALLLSGPALHHWMEHLLPVTGL